ncbi:hypothetical protein NMB32_16520 [Stenotrophomonas sp. CD2]|nr:hypothetical protein NMB32_16520 [Stenotrophomonas sp. CD2]
MPRLLAVADHWSLLAAQSSPCRLPMYGSSVPSERCMLLLSRPAIRSSACSIGATAACAPCCAPAAICCSRRTAWLPSSSGSDGAGLAGALSW